MNNKLFLSAIVPLASLLMLPAFSITFCFLPYQVHHHTSLSGAGVIVIGLILLIVTPTAAYLYERSTEK